MLNDEFKNIVNFGQTISNIDGLYEEEKENSKYTKLIEKGFSKYRDAGGITKPLIEDDGLIIFNKLKEFILEKYKENNYDYINMFGGRNPTMGLKEIIGDIDINILSELYVKEKYGIDTFNTICKNISTNLPNDILLNILNKPTGYGDIKISFNENCVIKNIEKQDDDLVEVLENNIIKSWYFYLYFIDTNTKEVKSFFNEPEIKEILEQLAKNNVKETKKDTLTKAEYIFLGNGKIPILNNINDEEIKQIKDNYYLGKEVISKKYTISWYGVNIEIIPSELETLLNKDQIYNLLEFINVEISKYNEQSKDKQTEKDEQLKIQFNLFHLLYNIYNNFINEDFSKNETIFLNILPFTFIFRNKKDNNVIEIVNGISLNNIFKVIEDIKSDLMKYEKYKNISNEDVIKIINRLLYKNVNFSNYTDEKGYAPPNDFLLKIKFIKFLLLGNKDKAYAIIQNMPDFVKKEKKKHFNGTSKSNGYLARWNNYDVITELTGVKNKNTTLENKEIDEKLYEKNHKLYYLIKDYLKINPNFIEKLIIKSKTNNIDKIKDFMFDKLIHFTLQESDIKLEGKKTYLNNLLKDLNIVDILYLIQLFIPYNNKEANNEDFFNGRLYDANKKFLFSKFVNTPMTEKNKINMILEYISKVYINLPHKRYLLKDIIKYFYKNIDNTYDIEIYLLKTLIK